MVNKRTRNSLNSNDPVTPTPVTTPRTPTAAASSSATSLSDLSIKSVWLYDWWLSPAPARGLAVEGFESIGRKRVRVIRSAAIAKRHNANTLETIDGTKVTVSGLINRSRSHQNGFPLEVCRHFLLGFPYYWEEYAARNYNEESADGGTPKQSSGVFNRSSPLPASLRDQPASRIHDLLMFAPSEGSNLIKTILDDLLENSNNCASEYSSPISEHLNRENKGQTSTVSSVDGENLSTHKKMKVSKTCRGNDGVLDRRSAGTDEVQINGQSKIAANVLSPSTGVTTRSMSRLKNLWNKQENNLSAKSSMKHKNSDNLENKLGEDLPSISSVELKNRSCLLTSGTTTNNHSGEDLRELSSRSSVRHVNGAQTSDIIENKTEENHKSKLDENPAKAYIRRGTNAHLSALKTSRSQLGGMASGNASRGIGGTSLSGEHDASSMILVCGLPAISAERRRYVTRSKRDLQASC
ncbi:hypothetical protein SLA2020_384860 [Shorea laevis]